ncbi:hypothetical protein CTAYLR_002586 [Chrysophaeum taylorii]|uniref:non-specific serine/threonine protein kinase n=1 Tax=Chrysophaeum taylorii TaxID=2483200 RepID=A0AAD7UD00_9STRA|nr:hypothetical protein CTAYLR_002586 [Chrysophaeum taylorii]
MGNEASSTSSSATKGAANKKKGRKLRTEYTVHSKILGEGHYGTVRLCVSKADNVEYAVKSINKSRVSKTQMLASEVEIMAKVDHPNIIKVVDIFDEKDFLHIVTELCTGGELFERIIEKSQTSEKSFSEKDASVVLKQILEAVAYCHGLDPPVVHRDLKPENFLFKDKSESSPIKIIDFGLSKLAPRTKDLMHTRVGTPYYIAPEVLRRDYTMKCDVWSVGVIAYILLCGYPPFYGDNDREIFRRVAVGKFSFPSPEWDHISSAAKDLVGSLLKVDADLRPTAVQALEHDFFKQSFGRKEDASLAAVARRMRRFVRMTKLKRLALNVLSRELTSNELQNLRSVFNSIDKDGSGKISAQELQDSIQAHTKDASIKDLVEAVDVSGDQEIDYHEFLAATMQRNCYLREDNIRRVFEHLDLDSTGHITFQNLIDITGSKKHAAELLKEADVDNDRKISYDEFKDIMVAKQ